MLKGDLIINICHMSWPYDRLVGVAPDVTLLVYKVFSPARETDEGTLIDSFLKAYDDGVG